ncbi:aminoglycoside phosphotransferase family protein [Actinoplanes sp. N902-109]|uniref:aminoglycoside phosphotransferase family protein n=1 Tax=Actinoplanes sp. (strain N902-109) TaxID=649831 RepID=UPI0003294C4F|nr:aminoglycoside phosphotransferase family protein [Actinoplanes sp. N902-109]AGL21312.1 aminoglycoside phosphotransferase [Actinoplanes sp. N902-109]
MITGETVAALVAAQFPQWRSLPVHPVLSHGTVNAIFRLGTDIMLRFPLRPSPAAAAELAAEQDHARMIGSPSPLGLGAPGPGYPGAWSAWRWIPGRPATPADAIAGDLAAYVQHLRALPTGGRTWNGRSRGGPLHLRDADVRQALAASTDLVDTARLAAVWQDSCAAPPHPGPDVWLHADLMPGNLLVRNGRLAAVIDLGTVCIGDPAVDLMPAWNLFPPAARAAYRAALTPDDAEWARGRGWALCQAIVALPYYLHTNPVMAGTARHTLAALVG